MIVDCSRYDGVIDWISASAEVELAIIQGQRYDSPDPQYHTNAHGCVVNGVPFGTYLRYGGDLNHVKSFMSFIADTNPLVLVLDCEDVGLTAAQVSASVAYLRSITDKKLGLYIAHHRYAEYNLNVDEVDFVWIPRYGSVPPAYPCDLWQYSETGIVAGFPGACDLNRLNSDKTLEWFIGGTELKITTSAGHSYAVDGAQGCGFSEHAEAVRCNNKFIQLCQTYGVAVSDCTSEAGTQAGYLREQVQKANTFGATLAVQWHFNAYNGSAEGTECLYLTEYDLSVRVSGGMANAGGFLNRGAKKRTDLYWLNETSTPAILIELCFIDNKDDMDKYVANFDKIIEAVFTAITGIEVGTIEPDEDEPKSLVGVHLHEANNTEAQLWYFIKDGEYVKIQSAIRDMVLDVADGSSEPKTPVRVYANDNGTSAQRFKLIPHAYDYGVYYTIESALKEGMVLDVVNGNIKSGAGIQLYKSNDTPAQQFLIVPFPNTDGYMILSRKSGLPLDVDNAGE